MTWIDRETKRRCPGSCTVRYPPLLALAFVLSACAWNGTVRAQEPASRTIPSRIIPIPAAASSELQKFLGRPSNPGIPPPKTTDEWRALSEESVPSDELVKLRNQFGVTVVPQVMGGVRCYVITPKVIQPRNRGRLLLNLHHGGFIWGRGEFGAEWSVQIAGLTGFKVIVVDYRLLPDHPFPAAMDDAMAVWKHVIKSTKPSNVAVIGGSVGGAMALSLVQRAKSDALPLPGAVISMSPAAADLSKTGDSYYTNAGVDGTISYDGFWEAAWRLYANGRDLKDPAISPIYGDFNKFPPTYLVSGTRDLFLSDTVRVQRKLLQAGVPTQLVVVEGLPHPGFLMVDIPEVAEIYSYIARFCDAHLGH